MNKQETPYTSVREWAKELVDIIPDGKLMGIVGILEGAALIGEGDDPFYTEDNLNRLRKARAQIDAGNGLERAV